MYDGHDDFYNQLKNKVRAKVNDNKPGIGQEGIDPNPERSVFSNYGINNNERKREKEKKDVRQEQTYNNQPKL